jgi:hypothetical protein
MAEVMRPLVETGLVTGEEQGEDFRFTFDDEDPDLTPAVYADYWEAAVALAEAMRVLPRWSR